MSYQSRLSARLAKARKMSGVHLGALVAFALIAGSSVNAQAWSPNAPASVSVYTDQQKIDQSSAAAAALAAMNQALDAGRTSYTFSATGPTKGVYRFHTSRSFSLTNRHNFAINAAGCTFVEDGVDRELVFMKDCSNISINGPLVIEGDPLRFSQARVVSIDPSSNTAQVEVMPGYPLPDEKGGTIMAYTPYGTWISPSPNKQWPFHRYSAFQPQSSADSGNRTGTLHFGSNDAYLMTPGNFLALGEGPLVAWMPGVDGFTLRDVTIYTGCAAEIASGGGTGNWNFIRVKAIREPGTSRLIGGSGPQIFVGRGANMLFDTCSFQGSTDDDLNAGSSNSAMVYKQTSPTTVALYGGDYQNGDELAFYANGTYGSRGTAHVVSSTSLDDPEQLTDAQQIENAKVRFRQKTDTPLYSVILDKPVTVFPGDLLEDKTGRGNTFTMVDCNWTDATVRVMAQGFKTGIFNGNTFTRVTQGLAVTQDAWWWEGSTWDHCVISNNTFTQTPYGTYWNAAAVHYGISMHATSTDLYGPVAITGNTINGGAGNGIQVNDATECTLTGNHITNVTGTPIRQENIGSGTALSANAK